MIHPRFREDKTTQAAAHLLKLRGGRMSHLKLMKLLYLADRDGLIRHGRPISFDSYVAMPHGPVLSFTLDKLNQEIPPEGASYWQLHISEKQNNEVSLLADPGNEQLSEVEEQVLTDVFQQFGRMGRWQLRDYTHDLPEWRDPEGSSRPIAYEDILRAAGVSEGEITEITEELSEVAFAASHLG